MDPLHGNGEAHLPVEVEGDAPGALRAADRRPPDVHVHAVLPLPGLVEAAEGADPAAGADREEGRELVVGVHHGGAVLGEGREQGGLLLGDGAERAEVAEMGLADVGDHGDAGPRQGREERDLAGVAGADLQHEGPRRGAGPDDGEGDAEVVVEGLLGAHRRPEGRRHGPDHLLGGRLPVGAGDRHHRRREAGADVGGQPPEGVGGIVHAQQRKTAVPVEGVAALHDGGGGAPLAGRGEEAVAVGLFPGEGEEQVPGLEGAGVDGGARRGDGVSLHGKRVRAHRAGRRVQRQGVHGTAFRDYTVRGSAARGRPALRSTPRPRIRTRRLPSFHRPAAAGTFVRARSSGDGGRIHPGGSPVASRRTRRASSRSSKGIVPERRTW